MMYLEISSDGKTWTRTGDRFRSKAEARTWLDDRFRTPDTYEWRIGFLLLTARRSEEPRTFYRLVHSNGKEVRP